MRLCFSFLLVAIFLSMHAHAQFWEERTDGAIDSEILNEGDTLDHYVPPVMFDETIDRKANLPHNAHTSPDMSHVPIPRRRPNIVQVSPAFLEALRQKQNQKKPTNTPHNFLAHDDSSNDHNSDPLAARLSLTDIRDILAQIDPEAAKNFPKNLQIKGDMAASLSRIQASPLPKLYTHITIEFAPDAQTLPYIPHSKKLVELAYIHTKISPHTRIEIHAYARHKSRTEALRLSMMRAQSIKQYLQDQNINPAIIDIRALGRKTNQTPVDRADIVFRKTYGPLKLYGRAR